MANNYTTTAQVKALMPDAFTSDSTKYDAVIEIMVTSASRMIDSHLKREPGAFSVSEEQTRYFRGVGDLRLWIGELSGIPSYVGIAETSVVDDASGTGGTYTEIATSDYTVYPANALGKETPILAFDLDVVNGEYSWWPSCQKGVKIVGPFGFTSTSNLPDEIVLAANIQAVRLFKRSQQAFQDAAAVKEIADIRYISSLDPEAERILGDAKFQWLSL